MVGSSEGANSRVRRTGSAVARYKTATRGLWRAAMRIDGWIIQVDGRGDVDVVVLRLHRRAEASLGWLGASLLSIALLDTGFVQSPRDSCVETTSVSACTYNMLCQDCYIQVLY